MRTKIAAVAATALLVGGMLATASTASASDPGGGGSWDHTWTTTDAAHGGTIYVQEHGDILMVCDTAADGNAARAQVAYDNVALGKEIYFTITASGGNGSCSETKASDGAPYDLPENQEIGVTVYIGPDFGHENAEGFMNDN